MRDIARRRALLCSEAALVALGYAAMSRAMASLPAVGVTVGATFWPGAGLTVGVLALRPRSRWPALLAAIFVAEVAMDLHLGFSLPLSVGWGLANTAEPLVGAHLLTRGRHGRPHLGGLDSTVRFVLAAVIAGPLVGAVIGAAAGVFIEGHTWWPRVPRWFVGDGIGVLAIAPAILTANRASWRMNRSAVAAAAGLVAVTGVAFSPWSPSVALGLPYLVIPALVVVGVAAGAGGAAAGVLGVAAVVELLTLRGAGPFAHPDAYDGLIVAQLYLFMAAATALTVSALTAEVLERARREATLRAEALTDGLTGLANRRLLDDRLTLAAHRLVRGDGLAVVVIDLDGLKAVNDALGHRSGDAVLRAAGSRLEAIIRPGDTAARLGGDEFVAVCEGIVDAAAAADLGDRILAALTAPLDFEGQTIDVRASIGVGHAHGRSWIAPADLLHRADAAMYAAKRAGGGLVIARAGAVMEPDVDGAARRYAPSREEAAEDPAGVSPSSAPVVSA